MRPVPRSSLPLPGWFYPAAGARQQLKAPNRAIVTGSMFDTLAIARALTAADFTPAQAEALTDAVRQAAEHDAAGVDVGTLATKADLAALKGAVNFATKADLAALEPRLVKWIVGTGVAGAGLVVAALRLLG